MPPPAPHVASLLDLPSTILGRPPRRALLLAPLPPACGPHREEGEMIQPIPRCPQWFVEFMTGFREGIIAEALAIEAEESGAAVKSSVDAADTILRLSRERPDILKRTTQASARLWLGAFASDPCAGSSAPAVAWEQPEKTKPRRSRKESLARLVANAKKLGVDVTVTIADGEVTFRTGSAPSVSVDSPEGELQKWKAKQHAH